MFRSIRWRIGISSLTLIVVCMAILSVYLLNYVREYYLSNLGPQLVAQANLVAALAEKHITSGGSDDLDALVKRLGQQTKSRLTVIDRNGVVLGDSMEDPATMENHGQRPEFLQALSAGVGEGSRYSSTARLDMLYVAVPIHANGDVAGVARVSLPLQEVNESQQRAASTIAFAISLTGALVILLAFLVTGMAVRPVKQLTQMVRAFSAGRLDQRIRVDSQDEVGELAEAFNQMSERLEETIETVSNERNRMAAILSSMADGIIIVDGEGKVTLLNEASQRILRLPRQDYLGHSLIEVVRDHELARLVKDSIERRGGQEIMARLVETGVPRRILRAVITPIKEGETRHTLVVLQDLTELRRAETVRREFVANVSHELRTPLASIKALVETLRDGALEDTAAAKDFLTRMETEVDGLTQLVGELQELSRIESGQVALKPEPTAVLTLVVPATERLRTQAERSGVTLTCDVSSQLPDVLADGVRIQQVLINLVHNAIKFTPPGGQVTVSASAKDTAICLSVADTGIGIPSDDLPRIFERFYKADKSRSTGGTGLGLAIAKHIVQAHGGDIWAESLEGHGATFIFSLPIAAGVPE
ncbi:MAG: HAMP domain-containing protein [Chloroflexi bacterium]|nr:HAMP domain-containing protein [Chloroflexota bacterium]